MGKGVGSLRFVDLTGRLPEHGKYAMRLGGTPFDVNNQSSFPMASMLFNSGTMLDWFPWHGGDQIMHIVTAAGGEQAEPGCHALTPISVYIPVNKMMGGIERLESEEFKRQLLY